MNSLQTFTATLPVIFLVIIGFVIQRVGLLKEETIQGFKKLVVSITLPLLLFKAFATMVFEGRYLIIVAAVFFACVLVMFVSAKLRSVPGLGSPYSSFLMAGFEAGMLGYAIFSSIYGEASIPHFAVVDLGQVIFVFFILVTKLENQQGGKFNLRQTFINFLKSPVILGILGGILANFSGLYRILAEGELTSSLTHTAEILAGLTTPLVALAIGYELKFQKNRLILPLQTVALRILVWCMAAYLFNTLVIHQWMGLDQNFEAAVMLMAILPAPFVIPIYLKSAPQEQHEYILNTLSLGTVAALVGSVIIRLVY